MPRMHDSSDDDPLPINPEEDSPGGDDIAKDHWIEPRKRSSRRRGRRGGRSAEQIRENKRLKRKAAKKHKRRGAEVYLTANDDGDPASRTSIFFAAHSFRKLHVPKVFSFLDAPEATAEFLEKLMTTTATPSVKHVSVQAKECTKIGLDALVAMSEIVMRAERRRKETNKLTASGTWPDDLQMQIMFKASGIPHHLGLSEAVLTPEQEKLVHRCELFSGKSVKKRYSLARQRNEATENIRKYFDKCLNTVGFTLTRHGKVHLDKLVSEVIGNAEEHGGPWFTIGHWQLGDTGEGRRFGVCHVAIFNFGNSIYESFSTPDASPTIVSELRSLSDLHTNKGFFDLLRGTWDEETLWTLYALQERVSRFSGLPGNETRGNGTRDIVEFFSKLGNPGTMCIVSGHAYILFDGTYGFVDMPVADEVLKVITFNKSGTLNEPPDKDFVRHLPNGFPGTMISIRLTLDEEYLTALAGEKA